MSPSLPARRTRRLSLLPAVLAVALALPALAQDDPGDRLAASDPGVPVPRDAQVRRLREMRRTLMWKGARRRFAQAAKRVKELKAAKRHGQPPKPPGTRAGRPVGEDYPVPERLAPHASPLGALGVRSTQAVPGNVRVNNSATDTYANATQAEESIACLGDDVLVAWNDGEGTLGDYQGWGFSTDGGKTFTDGGLLPYPPGFPLWTWQSDPVVTVNEKTGRFYYCGLADADYTHNAIGIAIGRFSGASFNWDTALCVNVVPSTTSFLDKQWIAADSATGAVYVTCTTFTTTADWIDFYRSLDGGIHWPTVMQISQVPDNGYVQGSRVTVGPAGEVYATWKAIGYGTADDFKVRRSDYQGAAWTAEVAAASYYDHFGTGAPGYNRDRGIGFPSIAVDRTTGSHRGRVYVTWNESWDVVSQLFYANSGKVETEPNSWAAGATAFTPGQTLRGYLASTTPPDLDYWKFTLSAGQSVVFWADSIPVKTTYTLRLFAPTPDSLQKLAYGAELDSTVSSPTTAFFGFCAPVAGTYFLRMAGAYIGKSRPFRYRILTGYGAPSAIYRARDQRDVCLAWSDNGTTWSAPVRVNDNAIGFDDYLPEVAVGPDGCPYVTWFDYREDAYGSRCHQYASRSPDGGVTWQANARFTDAVSNFTTSGSNLAPNMGDYSSTCADGRYVRTAWADGRTSTSVDVWETAVDTWYEITAGPADRDVVPMDVFTLEWKVTNLNPLFANDYAYTLTSDRGWLVPGPLLLSGVAPGESGTIRIVVAVPDTVTKGPASLTLTVKNLEGTLARTSTVRLQVTGQLAVDPGTDAPALALAPVRPNPATRAAHLRFTLPREAQVTLRIYGLRGELVRTLVEGLRPAGPTDADWDGRDQSGRPVGSGAYFVRLESGGRGITQRMVWMR